MRYGNKILKAAALAATALAAWPVNAENLVFNSGFELGDNGYACVKYLRPDNNPEMKYEGAVIDTSTSASGKQSLRVPNRYAEQFRIFAREVKLTPGHEYTFSIALKSDAPGAAATVNLVSASVSAGWHGAEKKIKVTGQWQRYSFSIKVPADRKHPYYSLLISSGFEKDAAAGTMWIDDLQLTEGGEQPYRSFSGLELAAAAVKPVYFAGKDQQGEIAAILYNNSGRELKAGYNLEMIADNAGNQSEPVDGEKSSLASGELILAPHERKVINHPLPLNRLGAFIINPVVQCDAPVSINAGQVAIAGKYDRKPLDLDRSFYVAFNQGGGGGFVDPPNYGEAGKGYRTAVGMDEYLSMMGNMGCRLFRDWDYPAPLFKWRLIEKENGQMDFRNIDIAVEAAAKHGIAILPVLGDFQKKHMPEQYAAAAKPAADYDGRMGSLQGKIYLPPLEPWLKYVRQAAERYKGKITHYEIANEPNLYLSPADYLVYLKAANTALKTADPGSKTVGFCSTGDLGGALSRYLEQCFKAGGLNDTDIVSFHPYDAPDLYSVNPADRQIDELKALLHKYKGEKYPLWNSELYYLTGTGKDHVEKGFYRPCDAAHRFLTDLGEGLGQSINVPAETVFGNPWSPHFPAALCIASYYPNANYVAYNALARFFEGAKPVEKIRRGSDSICYVYEKDGRYLAAFWNYSGVKGLTICLDDAGGKACLYDLYGNQIGLKKQPLPLTENPYYLTWQGDRRELVKFLREAAITADKPVQTGEAVRLLPDNGGWIAAAAVKNCSGQMLSGKAGIQGEGMIGRQIVDFNISAGKTSTIMIPVELKGSGPQNATMKIYVNNKLWDFPVQVMPAAKTYPVRTVEGTPESVQKNTGRQQAGHQASFSFGYDDHNLSLSIFVKDNTPSGAPDRRNPWEQDCIELFFDAAPGFIPEKYINSYHDYVARLFILPYAEPENRLIFQSRGLNKFTPENVKCVVNTMPDGYAVKLTIALEALQVPQTNGLRLLGFDIAVDNAVGGEKAVQQLMWNSSGDAYKNRCSFGFIELTK